MTEPAVRRSGHHYEIRVDGELAGLTQFRDREDQRVFYHTEIAGTFRGKGMSAVLIAAALDDTRAADMRIVPVCPAVAKYLTKHTEFADITDPVAPDILNWLDAVLA
ncbi:GNAT family N-acetyltransferase [Actinophytocola sp.]|uniref:GNAT family N-acetyltransferase n=1 Tax=Actinophytocola sp. TaxID=1872138 RepID=UPI002ED13870